MALLQKDQIDEDGGLPRISVQALINGDRNAVRITANAIGNAAREFGFFQIVDHGIDPSLIEATYRVAGEFFALPEAEKLRYYIARNSNHRGYVPFSEKGDYPDEVNRNYEAFDLGLDLPANDPDYLAGCRVLGPNVWPTLDGFRDTVARYYAQVSSLGQLVCSALELHLGLPAGTITGQMTKPVSQLRLLHYVRRKETVNHRSVNMGAHTDYECLTLLHTRNHGLQVMTRDDHWIDVPADPAVLVINIGDMLEAWSNGLLRSTPHRVLNKSPERFSLPYFVAANYDTVIEPFPQLVNADRPARYQPFLAGAHLERMLVRDFPYLQELNCHGSTTVSGGSKTSVHNPFERRLTGDN